MSSFQLENHSARNLKMYVMVVRKLKIVPSYNDVINLKN